MNRVLAPIAVLVATADAQDPLVRVGPVTLVDAENLVAGDHDGYSRQKSNGLLRQTHTKSRSSAIMCFGS